MLISIIVITYNSAKYVLETLESAKAQTYQNIELIVSDDCSTDDTVEICRRWISENSDRFFRTQLITVRDNTGIPANCNRGVEASKGKWIKLIAGDDILLPVCIRDNMNHISLNTEVRVLQTLCDVYRRNFATTPEATAPSAVSYEFFELDAVKQYQRLLVEENVIYSPSIFMEKSVIVDLGGFNESFRLFEDYPMWLKITGSGIKIHLLKKSTVGYRIHESITAANTGNRIYNTTFIKEIRRFRNSYIVPIIPWYNILFFQAILWDDLQFHLLTRIFKNKKSKTTDFISYLFAISKIKTIYNKFCNAQA